MTKRSNLPLLIGALWIAEVTGSFETAMILAALKQLITDFGDPAVVGWLITGYLIVGAAVAAIVGRIGDIYGRRQTLTIVLAIGAIGSIISAMSENFSVLLVGRLMQGVTGAILPLCIGLVHENLTKDRAPMAIGLMISGASVGTAAGLVVGGMIVDQFSWHGIFFTSAGLCLTAAVSAIAFIPKSPRITERQSVDWISGLAFAPAIAVILVYFSTGKMWGWASVESLAALITGTGLLGWWVRRSLSSPNPLIAIRSFRNRTIAVGSIVTALVAMGTLQITVFFSLLLQAPTWTIAGLGLSATLAGVAKLPSNLSSTFAGPLGGWLAGRGGGRMALVVGGTITLTGWVLVLIDTSSFWIVVAELIVISFGATMLFSVVPTIIAQASPPDRISEISGMLTVIRQLFLGVGAQMIVTLLATDVVQKGEEIYPSPFAYDLAVVVIIALCFAAILVALALPRTLQTQEAL